MNLASKVSFFFDRSKEAVSIKTAMKTLQSSDVEKIYSQITQAPHLYSERCLNFILSQNFKALKDEAPIREAVARVIYAANWERDRRIAEIVRI